MKGVFAIQGTVDPVWTITFSVNYSFSTLIPWYSPFSFSITSLILYVRLRHQIVLMDVRNSVLADKILTPELVTPRHIQPLPVILLSLMHALIFHPQTPLSFFFHLSQCDWIAENSASGGPFSTWRFLDRGQIAMPWPLRGQPARKCDEFSIPELVVK